MNSQNLSIEIVWKDEHMIEVEVCVSNDSFSGVSRFYDSNVTYLELASELKSYFSSDKPNLKNTFCKGDELFSLSAQFINDLGHISIDISLQQSDYANSKVINSVKLNANTDLASIDKFCEELEALGTKQSGIATLSFIATYKPFKRENLQLAFLASLVILANYKFPLNGALELPREWCVF